MTLLARLLERREQLYGWQTVPEALFGVRPTLAGPSVTEESAVRIIAVYRALSLLSGTLASLPIRAYRMVDGQPQPVESLLLDFPGGRDPVTAIPFPGAPTGFLWWERAYAHLWAWGNAYAAKVRSVVRDDVVRLEPLLPWRVQPKLVPPTGRNPAGKVFAVLDDDGMVDTVGPNEVLHIPGFGFDPAQGISPIGCARQALGLAVAAEEYGARLFGSGSLMGGVLETDADLTPEQAAELKAAWNAKVAGLGHAHEVAVLDNGAHFRPVTLPPKDSQFLESRKFGVTEVARLYGIPPHLLGDVEVQSSWGTGIEAMALHFATFTLRAPATRVEQVVSNELLPRGQFARIDFTDLLRGDAQTRFDAMTKATGAPVLTVNEARKLEGLPPVPGGNKLLMQGAMVPFSTTPRPAPARTPPPPAPADPEPASPSEDEDGQAQA